MSTYLAILTADGLGNIAEKYVFSSDKLNQVLDIFGGDADMALVVTKVSIFVLVIVLLSIKGAFEMPTDEGRFGGLNLFGVAIFSFLSAGLIVSTLLIYVSGYSFVEASTATSNIVEIYSSSQFVKIMVDYYNFWFSMPAVALIIWSLFIGYTE